MCAPSLIGFKRLSSQGDVDFFRSQRHAGRFEHKLTISAVWIGTWDE